MNTDLALPAPASGPDRVGQGTVIEQSRAVAQVQAAVIIAHQYPRDIQRALREMKEACARPTLAKAAFYSYPRGGEIVTGPTIKLAQEVACMWGNVDFGFAELRVDTVAGESEMLAYAWDLETNTRFSQIVIVKHLRDKTVGGKVVDGKKVGGTKVAEALVDQRDIYEANTNNAARRLRECIRRVIPAWYFEEAEARCRTTIEDPGDGLTLPQRIAQVLRGFGDRYGIGQTRVEARVGKPCTDWTAWDVAQLTITGESIVRGDITIAEAFPVDPVTASEITSRAAQAGTPTAEPGAAPEQPMDTEPVTDGDEQPAAMVDRGQLTRIHTLLTNCGVSDKAERRAAITVMVGRPIESSSELTRAEGDHVIAELARVAKSDDAATALGVYLAELNEAGA